ncbi:MAG: DUF308 domain-containing protein [Candidatus Bathyarchaeota archaeon]|nr:DUF308 domain-containing protein [Candidatus Bathyarchaeota archaeon]
MSSKSPVTGGLMILVGLVLLAFPWFGLWTIASIMGFALILAGLGLLVFGIASMGASKATGIVFSILGILALVIGVGLFGNIGAFAWIASFVLYLAGFILIIAGVVQLFQKPPVKYGKTMGIIGVILGVIYIILGSVAIDPSVLSILMGIWLIIMGIGKLL